MPQRDYGAIKSEYVEGQVVEGRIVYPSLDELAAKHGTNAANLRKRAGKEKWKAARSKFAAKVQQVSQDKKALLIGTKAAQLDATAALIATDALRAIHAEVAIVAEAKTVMRGKKRVRAPLNRDAMKSLMDSAEKAQRIGRLALGQPLESGAPPTDPNKEMPDLRNATDDELRNLAKILSRVSP